MKKLFVLIIAFVSLLCFHSSAFADWPVAGNASLINSNTVQIDNLGSGWSGCSGFWYAQVYSDADNYLNPRAGGTLGNNGTGSSCQEVSSTSIRVTFTWPYNFYFFNGSYKILYTNNNNYDTSYVTNYFTVSSATPPQDNNTYAILYSDSFTDVDGTLLTAHNSNWTLYNGPEPLIQNNQLVAQAQADFYLQNFTTTTDQCLSFDVQFPLNGGIYFKTRYDPNTQNSFFSYLLADDNSYGIYDVVNGNASYINSGSFQLPSSGIHNIKQCSIGSNTVIYFDNLSIASGVSSDNPTGTAAIYESGFSQQPNTIDNVLYQSVNSNNTPTPTPTSAPTPTPTPIPVRQLAALSPAKVWVGLKNSDDVGVKFDLKAEAYVNNTLVNSGELDTVNAGSSGFNNAKLDTINFNSFSPVDFPSGSSLSIKLYVRNACSGSGHNSGTARLWYNDSQANSNFGATIDTSSTYYLVPSAMLSTSIGVGPKQTVDVQSGAKCSPYKLFGTWSITP